MKKLGLFLLFGILLTGLYSCSKDTNFDAQGGDLPTHYITFRDSVFSPSLLEVANGSSITFLNQTSNPITLKGNDSTLLKTVLIQANSFYFFKPDTIPPVPAQISIPYHCIEFPAAGGTIILLP